MRAFAPLVLAALVTACSRSVAVDAVAEPAPTAAASAETDTATESKGASARRAPAPKPAADEEPDPYPWPAGYTPPTVWETRKVVVDGVAETWSLRWRRPPRWNGCFPWSWCDCSHLEWGLRGQLDLVRERPGEPEERLDLAALRDGQAQIAGFVQAPDDSQRSVSEPAPRDQVVKRPHAVTLKLGDYDHDGRATEFVFQIGYLACGQQPSVLVGISKANPHLHVFGTAENPGAGW